MSLQSYYAHGKLMLSGEYAVLDGAKALALPTKFGQKLQVKVQSLDGHTQRNNNTWQGINSKGQVWLDTTLGEASNLNSPEERRISEIISFIKAKRPELFQDLQYQFTTSLEFPNNWGLGSSSTLISLLAQWADLDPYELLKQSFGGSGYDIACATANQPILFHLEEERASWQEVSLSASWTDCAYFVFLEQKKNSRDAIKHYRALQDTKSIVAEISSISTALSENIDFKEARYLFEKHEEIMSKVLRLASINEDKFSDFAGVCKSLGAWGGDFIMALSNTN
ncbi:MAG: mevalonate kinase, partial [Bacteroidetes bacterium]|nr:mevalonate kinase [Bacteroidota bacterium]